jgi:hypothetical protein
MDEKLPNIRTVLPNLVLRLATWSVKAHIIISLNIGVRLCTAL